MSDIKLFRVEGQAIRELNPEAGGLEKSLQTLIEQNLEGLFGVRFLATEHPTGKTHGGRIDTLGIDENRCPVILEYKRSLNENVINQGLYYLDWLLDHKAEFESLVRKHAGKNHDDPIEWPSPRLICVAADFTKFDEHAVQQINRNIQLVRYRRFGGDLLVLELVNATSATEPLKGGAGKGYKTISETLGELEGPLLDLFASVKAFLLALGDDVQMKVVKYYVVFRRIKNFACVEVHPAKKWLTVFAKVDPTTIILEKGFSRDVTRLGHFGTGDLEITIRNSSELERAKPLLLRSYEAS